MLISFGFDAGEQVVFSVEIRREKIEEFSEIGGFFKEFELRSSPPTSATSSVCEPMSERKTYLYRVRMPVAAMRSLFLSYVEQANALVRVPRFYNTITVNCTTLVYEMMKRIVEPAAVELPAVLLPGYLPEYVYRVGGMNSRYPLEVLRARGRLTERAKAADRSETFSTDRPRGIPAAENSVPEPSLDRGLGRAIALAVGFHTLQQRGGRQRRSNVQRRAGVRHRTKQSPRRRCGTSRLRPAPKMVPDELYVGWLCKNRSCALVMGIIGATPGNKPTAELDDPLTAITCPHCGNEDLYRWSARSELRYTPRTVG